jgi:hypothetical protein
MRTLLPLRPTGSGGPSESLRLLCFLLSEPGRGMPAETVDWVALAAAANGYLVAPALWCALDRKGLLADLPDDFRDYLAAVHQANAIRTDAIYRQAGRALAALNASGIAPLVLKGGARLFEGMREAGHARMMADLDLLVEEPRFDQALGALLRLGYAVADEDEARRRRLHATTLRCPGEPVAIDLHREIGPQRAFIPLAEAVAAAVPVTAEECRLRLLSPTHRIMHLFFHAQIHDRGHLAGVIPLRHLEDFAWIAARHARSIDWAAIARACDRLRCRGAWQAWLYLADRCLATSADVPARWPFGARLHYRRCLFQLDHRWAGALLRPALAITEPLSYANIDYQYGCGAARRSLLRARAVETLRLLGKYRHRIPQRLAAAIRDAREKAS